MNIFTKIKNTKNFTNTEQVFADFVLTHPSDIINDDIKSITKKAYVSTSTVYRVIDKLDLSGLSELKRLVSNQYEAYLSEVGEIDYNYPFKPHDTHHQILNKMEALYNQSIASTKNLMDLDVLLKIVQLLEQGQRIVVLPGIGNVFAAESFQMNMRELGKNVEVDIHPYDQHLGSCQVNEDDVVIIISYLYRAYGMVDFAKNVKERGAKLILITSTVEGEIFEYADYHLYMSSYENREEKIASFSTRVSLQYLLDCIYACYFDRNYAGNMEYRLAIYKEF